MKEAWSEEEGGFVCRYTGVRLDDDEPESGQRDEERIERGGVLEGRGGVRQVPPGGRGVRQGRGRVQVLAEGEAGMSGRLRGAVMAAAGRVV